MAFSLKEDWEQTKRNIAKLEQGFRLDAACQGWNHRMIEVVNGYKQEEVSWYNQPGMIENAFQTTTQNLWYTHYLNKKRLQMLGLEAKYEYIQPTNYIKEKNQRFPQWDYSHDGKNLICKVSDYMRYRKLFLKNGKLVWADEGKGMPGEYYIMQSRSMNGSYICPNCGREDTLQNLVDGCDYCGTKFQIEDFNEKVSSVYRPGSSIQRRDGFTLLKNFWPLYFVLAMLVMAAFIILPQMGGIAMLLLPVVMLALMVIFLAVLIGKSGTESVKEGPAKNAQTLEQLRAVDPLFSEEAFIGNLSNKLMSIYYAESMNDIRPFVECEMTPLLNARKGVMDCKMLECVLLSFRSDNQYQYLEVKVKSALTVYENNAIGTAEDHLQFYLVRSIQAVTKSTSDVNVYTCHSCGANLSLLNGGRCEHCGNGLDLKVYDWVIAGFQVL